MSGRRGGSERLLSGGQYRGLLQHCGEQAVHDPHVTGQAEVGAFYWHLAEQERPSAPYVMDRICLGVEDVLDVALREHPAGGLCAIEPIPGQPIAFTYIGPDDEQEFLASVAEGRQVRSGRKGPRRDPAGSELE